MTTMSLSPSKIAKLQEVFGAALRKAYPTDQEAQELIESHWKELEPELMSAFTAALNKVLVRIRCAVRISITSVKEFVKPDWMKRLVKGNDPLEPGTYEFTFEEWLRDDETSAKGDEMVRRAASMGADSDLQAALHLLDNQHLIPEKLRGKKYLIFAGTEALLSDVHRFVAYLRWDGDQWYLNWRWLGFGFGRRDLLVRSRKVA